MATILFLTDDVVRSLGLVWVRSWLSIGGVIQVREMPAGEEMR
ncbi:hypothetical protein LCGC14_1946580 [marine sediment metagenome]|uniref:Uncharacterized protein n=1 Tax=marine sediment metagenome TaxID=412755 RepID=A0A0F9G742_9ZZZZ